MLENRMGVFLSEAQKQILETGEYIDRAFVIQDVVNQSWAGLAEQMAQTPEGMRAGMTNAFNDIRSAIAAQLMPVIMVLFATIQSHMPQIEATLQMFVPALLVIIGLIDDVTNVAFSMLGTLYDLNMIEPILWGIVAALAAWKVSMVIAKIKVWALNGALTAKNALLAGIPLIIGAIVAGIAIWVDSVGGLYVAWLHTVNAVLTALDWMKTGFYTDLYRILDLWDVMVLGMRAKGTAIENFMGDMRANVLIIVQSMVNDSISLINGMISVLNNLPGVELSVIEQVTFGEQAQRENESARQARNAALEARGVDTLANMTARAERLTQMQKDAYIATAGRMAEISELQAAARYEAEQTDNIVTHGDLLIGVDWGDGFGGVGRNVASIAANTGTMASISGENLKYWRDIAERDNINRFTTARVYLRIPSITNNVNSNMDLDDVVDYILEGVEEGLEITAERTNDYV